LRRKKFASKNIFFDGAKKTRALAPDMGRFHAKNTRRNFCTAPTQCRSDMSNGRRSNRVKTRDFTMATEKLHNL